jgi:hypothetical protein
MTWQSKTFYFGQMLNPQLRNSKPEHWPYLILSQISVRIYRKYQVSRLFTYSAIFEASVNAWPNVLSYNKQQTTGTQVYFHENNNFIFFNITCPNRKLSRNIIISSKYYWINKMSITVNRIHLFNQYKNWLVYKIGGIDITCIYKAYGWQPSICMSLKAT